MGVSIDEDYYYIKQLSAPSLVYGKLLSNQDSFVSAFQVRRYQKRSTILAGDDSWYHHLNPEYYYKDTLISSDLSGLSISKNYLETDDTYISFTASNGDYTTNSFLTTNYDLLGISSLVLSHSKVDYDYGETPSFVDGDTLIAYDSDGNVLYQWSGTSISNVLSVSADEYSVWGKNHNEVDGAQVVSFAFKFGTYSGLSVQLTLYFTYSEDKFSSYELSSSAKTSYYWSKSVTAFDFSGLTFYEKRHTNKSANASNPVITEIAHTVSGASYPFSLVSDQNSAISYTDSIYYALSFTSSNELSQTLSYSFTTTQQVWHGEPLSVISVSIGSATDYSYYWDNGVDKFHLPTSDGTAKTVFTFTYNDGTTAAVASDSTSLSYYSDSAYSTQLTAGTSVINPSSVSHIYFRYTDSTNGYNGASIVYANSSYCNYIIGSKHDYIDSLTSTGISIVKGNYLAKYHSSLSLTAHYKSGEVSDVSGWQDWYFKFTDILGISNYDYTTSSVTIVDNDKKSEHYESGVRGQFTISGITFVNPDISSIELSSFGKNYNNSTDKVDLSTVTAKVHYSNSDYVGLTKLTSFPATDVTSTETGTLSVYCSTLAAEYLNGTSTLAVSMGDTTELAETIKFSTVNDFDSTKTSSTNDTINVYEITNIKGISFGNNPFTDYKVGDKFLSEKDNTIINVYYSDTAGVVKHKPFLLRNALSMINIYPMKGTEFVNAVASRVVKVSSALDSNVSLSYDISVSSVVSESTDPKTYSFKAIKLGSSGLDDGNYVETYDNSHISNGYGYTVNYRYYGYYKYGSGHDDFWYQRCKRKIVYTYKEATDFEDYDDTEHTKIDLSNCYVLLESSYTETPTKARTILTGYTLAKDINDINIDGNRKALIYGWISTKDSDNSVLTLLYQYPSPVDGESNVTVYFPHYDADGVSFLDKMKHGCLFGHNNAVDRLWLFGNESHKNQDIHSSEPNQFNYDGAEALTTSNGDFSYFSSRNIAQYGDGNNEIVGYDVISDSKLLVLKNHYGKEPSIYFRVPEMVQWYDWMGVAKKGVDGNSLYEEEYTNTVSNSPVSGLISDAIVNFNGDTLFIDNDNEIAGMDVEGIIGDSQRQANTRSYFIDKILRDSDMSKAVLFTSSRLLFLGVPDVGLFVADRDSKSNNQYEWWLLDGVDASCISEIDGEIYLADDEGYIYKFDDETFYDKKRIFADDGEVLSVKAWTPDTNTESGKDNTVVVVSDNVITQLNGDDDFYFAPIYQSTDFLSKLYRRIGVISSGKSKGIYCDSANNRLALIDSDLTNLVRDSGTYYLNNNNNSTYIVANDSSYSWQKPYKLVLDETFPNLGYPYIKCYKLTDGDGKEIDLKAHPISSADFCQLVDYGCRIKLASDYLESKSFTLVDDDGNEIDIIHYKDQANNLPLKAEITKYSSVKSRLVTAPLFSDSMNYFKTIWKIDISNGTEIPSDMEIAYVTNKIPSEQTKKISSVSKAGFGLDFSSMDFSKMDFDKKLVPRCYSVKRTIPRLKTICFAFQSENAANSVIPSLELTYTIPFPSKGSD